MNNYYNNINLHGIKIKILMYFDDILNFSRNTYFR